MFTFVFLSLIGSWISLGGNYGSAPEVTVVEADLGHVVIKLDLSGYNQEQFSEYSRITIPEYGWDLDTPTGNPELPMVSVVIGMPAETTPSTTILEANWVSAGTGTPYPVQPLRTDDQQEPFFFVDIPTDLNGVFPENSINLFQQGNWAGVNTVVLQMNPFRWNASTGEFQVASSITARIDFSGTAGQQVSVRPEIARMHRSRMVNYEALNLPVDSSPVSRDDVVYICVVPPENLDAITPFLAMVNSLGHHVYILELAEGTTSYAIKNAISGVYQAGITRFALIAARHQQLESKNYGSFVGDYYYECMNSDNYPDIAVGRFSGNYTTLAKQAAKAMSYVAYEGEPGQPSLPASVVLAAHQENYPGKYTANSEAVRTWDYDLADIVFETVYPPEGGTPEDVSSAINQGVGIVNYRGHGSITTWQWTGGWNASDIYNLENTHFPPVFNVCCHNGAHDKLYNCLAESWLKVSDLGSSGNLASSSASFTIVNDRMQTVLFWELFDEGNTCAGEMFTAAQTDMIQTHGGSGLINSRMYHWFGDPSMDIPNSDAVGTPFAMTIDVPSYLQFGTSTLDLTVTSGGSPVEGAVVTITDGIGNHSSLPESFYQQQISNGSGEVSISFTALENRDLYYGVRLHNYASISGTIDVVAAGIEGSETFTAELHPVTPSPVTGMADISFTAPAAGNINISILDLTGRIVRIIHDGHVVAGTGSLILDGSELSPGVYFVTMQTSCTTITRKIAVVR